MRRTTDDRVWVGVAGGVAERLRVDAVVVRGLFVVATAIWGVGLFVYLCLWALLPEVDSPSRNVVRPGVRPTRFRGMALVTVVVGAVWVLRSAALLPPDRILLPWVLIMIGVVVLWARDPIRPLPRLALMAGPPNTMLTDIDFEEEPEVTEESEDEPIVEDVQSESGTTTRRGSQPALVPIGTLTAGSLLVACGLLYLLDDAGLVDVSWRLVGGVALTVVGVALTAGGWWGRPRGLIVAGTLLSVVLLGATVLQVPLRGGVGRRDLRPFVSADVADDYRLAIGVFVLDLRDVELEGRRDVSASVAAGELRIIIPIGVDVDVDARVGFGEVVVFDRVGSGVGVSRSFASGGAGSAVWRLDLDVGIGKLSVEQVP